MDFVKKYLKMNTAEDLEPTSFFDAEDLEPTFFFYPQYPPQEDQKEPFVVDEPKIEPALVEEPKVESTPVTEKAELSTQLDSTKSLSNQLQSQMNNLISHYEEKVQQVLQLEKEWTLKNEQLAISEQSLKEQKEQLQHDEKHLLVQVEEQKRQLIKDLEEREERISSIERKVASSSSVATRLGKNQVIKLNVGQPLIDSVWILHVLSQPIVNVGWLRNFSVETCHG